MECRLCGHVLDQRCNVVEFGLLRNVEERSNGRAGTAFLGQVAAGEGEGDEGFCWERERGGCWYLIQVSFGGEGEAVVKISDSWASPGTSIRFREVQCTPTPR